MSLVRLSLRLCALICALALTAYLLACLVHAQEPAARNFQPDLRRALAAHAPTDKDQPTRADGYAPQRDVSALKRRPTRDMDASNATHKPARRPARQTVNEAPSASDDAGDGSTPALINTRIAPGTPLRRVLHTAQLSTTSPAGTDEQYADASGDLVADH